jgi:hypothetical protein
LKEVEMPHPLVVNVKRNIPFDVYIGRTSYGYISQGWGNPFEIGRDGTREEVIEKYEEWIRSAPEVMNAAREQLKGKVLGCWCAPAACHGDVLARIANAED